MALVYIDTNVFIRGFESSEAEALPAKDLFRALRDRPGVGVTSELTLAELLAPAKRIDVPAQRDREELYRALLLGHDFIALRPISLDILLATPRLRLAFNHKLPDAIHVATAEQEKCRLFVTSDHGIRRLPVGLRGVAPHADGIRLCLEALAEGPGET